MIFNYFEKNGNLKSELLSDLSSTRTVFLHNQELANDVMYKNFIEGERFSNCVLVDYPGVYSNFIFGEIRDDKPAGFNLGIIYDKLSDKYIVIDFLDGLPHIKQPRNYDDLIGLIHTDPRLLKKVDPAYAKEIVDEFKQKNNAKPIDELYDSIIKAVSKSMENILLEQAGLDIIFDEEERCDRERFVRDTQKSFSIFVKNCENYLEILKKYPIGIDMSDTNE